MIRQKADCRKQKEEFDFWLCAPLALGHSVLLPFVFLPSAFAAMLILFLTSDLVFPSRVSGIAAQLGARLETVANSEALVAKLQEAANEKSLVLIDLNCPGLDVKQLVPMLRALANSPRAIVAFGPHVQEEKLAAAQAAGCDLVLPRGQFAARMIALLKQFLV